jgi:hypothetical protein
MLLQHEEQEVPLARIRPLVMHHQLLRQQVVVVVDLILHQQTLIFLLVKMVDLGVAEVQGLHHPQQ